MTDYLCSDVHVVPSDDADLAIIDGAPSGTEVHPVTAGAHGAHEPVQGVGTGVELALAMALERASAVGRWDVVLRLADELAARRQARAGVSPPSDQADHRTAVRVPSEPEPK
ncbi:MAG: hypothetical protein L6Q84_23580 [Polyangiaceae bacterium]|nr:hypothetical protein [Polyangiaceae bacterium]